MSLDEAVARYWGFTTFRPLQREAMEAVLSGRDSVVVLPTGGGKSLCFQAPAVVLPGLAHDRDRNERHVTDKIVGRIEMGPAGARKVDLSPGMGGSRPDVGRLPAPR